MVIKDLLNKYIEDPYNPENSYNLAIQYYKIDQLASAMGFFLRAAEMTEDDNLAYNSLCYSANILYSQGNRMHSSNGCALHAIALIPERPEAWNIYARNLEITQNWQECYSVCNTALRLCDLSRSNSELGYDGPWNILFEKAVVGYRIGKSEECREIFKHLFFEENVTDQYKQVILNNLEYLKIPMYKHTIYDNSMFDKLKYKFEGSENIERNYSQSYQDLFVLSAHKGKRGGKYLEVGSADPFYGSNTALLEKDFDWNGISIEIDEGLVNKFKRERKNEVICSDATLIDYKNLLDRANLGYEWDYLQLDCEPPHITYEILKKIPFDEYKFAVITFEHDAYTGEEGQNYRNLSREFLQSKGYFLLIPNVSVDSKRPYEDWWINPFLISPVSLSSWNPISNELNKAEKILIEGESKIHPLVEIKNIYKNGN